MEEYRFRQTYGQIQELLDKLELLPTRAELDAMLDKKVDKPAPYFSRIENTNVLGFFDGDQMVIVAPVDNDSGVFIDEHIEYGEGMDEWVLLLNSDAPAAGFPWNANGCQAADIGQDLNIHLPYVTTLTGLYPVQEEYYEEADFYIGRVIACVNDLAHNVAFKACEIKYKGRAIENWWIFIPYSTSLEMNDTLLIRNFLDEV